MTEYGETLARYRIEVGLNQRELGAAIGLDYTQLNKIERGHRPPLGAKYMKPLIRSLRLSRSEAENLVDLAGLSLKVLDFMDEVEDGEVEEKEDQHIPMANPAIALPDSLFRTSREEFNDLIDSAHLRAEEDEQVFATFVEIAKPILELIKTQRKMWKER